MAMKWQDENEIQVASSITEDRQQAESRFQSLERPHLKTPGYKFTSLHGLDWDKRARVQEDWHYLPCPYAHRSKAEQAVLRLRSASMSAEREGELPEGLQFCDLASASEKDASLLSGFESIGFADDIFAQWAMARWQSGYALIVPPGQKFSLGLRALQYFDESSEAYFFRNLIVLGEGAELSLTDDFESEPSEKPLLAVGLSQIRLARGARLHYECFQNWNATTDFFFRQDVQLEEGAHFDQAQVHMGGRKSQVRHVLDFKKAGASAKNLWTVRSSRQQHFDFWLHQEHREPRTESALDFYAISGDRSRVVFNGMQSVAKGAKATDSYQQLRSLLLSRRASVESLPQLLIAHDDVKIAHGSASSSVDPDQLYYLQSRGLEKKEAERLIVEGFAEPVLLNLRSEELRERARQNLRARSLEENERSLEK